MIEAEEKIRRIVIQALEPPPRITVSEHAAAHRMLPDDEAEPGNWKNERTPYLREILDRLGPYDDCREVVVMKGCQLGGTELILNAFLFWIEHSPGRILCVVPGEDEAKDFSLQRVQPMIESSPVLQERLGSKSGARGRPRGDSIFLKEFPGGSLKFTGSNAPAGLRSKPIRYLAGDELDGWARDSGGEGCPLILAEKRLGTFANSKKLLVSTPTDKPSRIEERFLSGDRRHYNVPCPHCGHMFVLAFNTFVIPEDASGDKDVDNAHMKCPSCDGRIDEWHKEKMLAKGKWIPEKPYRAFRRSYHVSSFYSPLGWLSWAQIADEWVRAQSNPLELKACVNTIFGESWDPNDGQSVDAGDLLMTREDWGDFPPGRILVATAGVDIQGDRIELEIVGWAEGYESWSLDYIVIPGDPTGAVIWEDLDAVLSKAIPLDDGRKLKIAATCIDSSYEADRVYAFTRARVKRRVWAIKGASDEARAKREIWPLSWRKSKKTSATFKLIGTSNAKRDLYAWLAKSGIGPGPGRCHFPKERSKDYFEQLTAEKMVAKWKRGFKWVEWQKAPGQRNEALDCRVYAYAALIGLERSGLTWDEAKRRKGETIARLDGRLAKVQDARQQPRERRTSGEVPRRNW